MAKTANINVRTDPAIKAEAEALFASFGITVSDAINIFLHKSIAEGGIPFEVRQPRYNAETESALDEYKEMKKHPENYKRYTSFEDAMNEVLGDA